MFFLIVIFLVALVVKGQGGNPLLYQSLNSKSTEVGGPFESSGSTSRFALTEAIVEDNTFFLNEKRAKFSMPDVVEANGRYFSIFTPGVSFVAVPFYMLGKVWGIPQIFAYLSTSLFAILNVFLIYKLTRKLGAGIAASLLAGFLFLFATNALSYSLTLTQHHISTFVILLSLILALKPVGIINDIFIGILCGIGLFADVPNLILMFPIIVFVLAKHVNREAINSNLNLKLSLKFISFLIGVVLTFIPFGYYNHGLTGSYLSLPQFIGRAPSFETAVEETYKVGGQVKDDNKGLNLPFKTRYQLHGLYILVTSNERGIFYFSPVILIGLVGLYLLFKQFSSRSVSAVFFAVILTNAFLYSMFGDVTGGWAFGARYMIPTIAILSVCMGIAIDRYKEKLWFIPIFVVLAAYSIGVNVLGVMTTTQIPPKVEALNLPNPIPYTYVYNWQLMTERNLNSSLVYNLYLSDRLTSCDYSLLYAGFVFGIILILYTALIFERKDVKQ